VISLCQYETSVPSTRLLVCAIAGNIALNKKTDDAAIKILKFPLRFGEKRRPSTCFLRLIEFYFMVTQNFAINKAKTQEKGLQINDLELPQEKGYREKSLAKGLNHWLPHIHGYRENGHEFAIEKGIFTQYARALPAPIPRSPKSAAGKSCWPDAGRMRVLVSLKTGVK
jgi:hypothetical protein